MSLSQWDGGAVFADHPDFAGRLTQVDGSATVSGHSTHVAGTLIGGGDWLYADSRGIAFAAHLDAYDWNSDTVEMAAVAASGELVSNHSYGIAAGWIYMGGSPPDQWWWIGGADAADVEDPNFGYYDSESRLWDQLAYDAPYYLPVKAEGNDRSDFGPAAGEEYTVIDQQGNFLFTSTLGGPGSVAMADFSSWGPTDDGRIKPDLVANGMFLFSAWADPPATPVPLTLDPPDLMLVNDLDLRVTRGPDTWPPWVLDPAAPAAIRNAQRQRHPVQGQGRAAGRCGLAELQQRHRRDQPGRPAVTATKPARASGLSCRKALRSGTRVNCSSGMRTKYQSR